MIIIITVGNNKKLHIVAALSVVAVMAVGLSTLTINFETDLELTDFVSINEADADNSETPKMTAIVEWNGYTDIQNMTNSASDIVLASVDKTLRSEGVRDPVTYFELNVKETFKGDLEPNQTIQLYELGGLYPHQTAIYHGIMVQEGNEYFFFLNEEPEYASYYALGGPNGKFVIQNDVVKSLDAIDSKVKDQLSVPIEPQNLSSFKLEVKDYVLQKELADKAQAEKQQELEK